MARLDDVPRRVHQGGVSALQGLSYPEQAALYDRMVAQDPSFVFDSLRPIGDEFWNLVDGRRTLGEIAEALCFQFDFELDPELFLPFADGLVEAGHLELPRGEPEQTP